MRGEKVKEAENGPEEYVCRRKCKMHVVRSTNRSYGKFICIWTRDAQTSCPHRHRYCVSTTAIYRLTIDSGKVCNTEAASQLLKDSRPKRKRISSALLRDFFPFLVIYLQCKSYTIPPLALEGHQEPFLCHLGDSLATRHKESDYLPLKSILFLNLSPLQCRSASKGADGRPCPAYYLLSVPNLG